MFDKSTVGFRERGGEENGKREEKDEEHRAMILPARASPTSREVEKKKRRREWRKDWRMSGALVVALGPVGKDRQDLEIFFQS